MYFVRKWQFMQQCLIPILSLLLPSAGPPPHPSARPPEPASGTSARGRRSSQGLYICILWYTLQSTACSRTGGQCGQGLSDLIRPPLRQFVPDDQPRLQVLEPLTSNLVDGEHRKSTQASGQTARADGQPALPIAARTTRTKASAQSRR